VVFTGVLNDLADVVALFLGHHGTQVVAVNRLRPLVEVRGCALLKRFLNGVIIQFSDRLVQHWSHLC